MAGWQWFGKLHCASYRATGGILGGKLLGLEVLLLTTTGRVSGEARTSPLPFLRDEDRFVIVGSNNGGPRDPHWWLNLLASPSAEIQVMRDRIPIHARLADSVERKRLWPVLVEYNPPFARYETKTEREIPVVVLERR